MARLHGTHLFPLSVVRPRCWGGVSSGESMATVSVTPGRARGCMRHAACGMRHAACGMRHAACGTHPNDDNVRCERSGSVSQRHCMLLVPAPWWQSTLHGPRSTHPRPADARIGSDYVPVVRNDVCHVCIGGPAVGGVTPPGVGRRAGRCRLEFSSVRRERSNTRNPIRINF